MEKSTSEQVGIQTEAGRKEESTKIQSLNRRERLSAEEGCGFRRDICPGREDDINPYSAEHIDQHGS